MVQSDAKRVLFTVNQLFIIRTTRNQDFRDRLTGFLAKNWQFFI